MTDDNNEDIQEEDTTQIQVAVSTRERLKKRGNKDDTYDKIINGLLDDTEE